MKNYKVISAVFAFIIWGSWSFYINRTESLNAGVVSGLVQGGSSAVLTLIMLKLVSYFNQFFTRYSMSLFMPAVITVSITGTLLTLIHLFAGTPNIFMTISPALLVAFLFCVHASSKILKLSDSEKL